MNELSLKLWELAQKYNDKLADSGMSNNEAKNYVIGLIFYKYISDKQRVHVDNLLINENLSFEEAYENESYKNSLKRSSFKKLRYFLKPSLLYDNFSYTIKNNKLKNNDLKYNKLKNYEFTIYKLKRILNNIENSTLKYDVEDIFLGIFDQIESNEENSLNYEYNYDENYDDYKNQVNLTNIIKDLILEIDDLDFNIKFINKNFKFVNAFNFLINQYFSLENKNNTQIPFEINKLFSNILKIENNNKNNIKNTYSIFGNSNIISGLAKNINFNNVYSEVEKEDYNLARMSMIVNDYDFDIRVGDLENPQFMNYASKFDFIIGSYPYSAKWSSNKQFLIDDRFSELKVSPPKTRPYFGYILHMLYLLSHNGTMVTILPSGVLFREGFEKKIREYLIKKNYIDTIIELPSNTFNNIKGSSVILIFKKNRTNNKILFIDASKSFKKLKNRNILRKRDIKNITNIYNNKLKSKENYSSMAFSFVYSEEIEYNDFNLNISRYINNINYFEDNEMNIKDIIEEIAKIDQKIEAIDEEIKEYYERLDLNKLIY